MLLGTASSAFASNLALSGDLGSLPNEILLLAFPNIALVVITGDPLGGSFTFDELAYQQASETPELSTAFLLLTALGSLNLSRRHMRS